MKIGDRDIGKGVFITAEIGNNHNGYFETAARMIEEAARCGADGVKLQLFRAERLVTESAPSHLPHLTGGRSIFERFKGLELSKEELLKLDGVAKRAGVVFFGSVFDRESADMVEEIMPVYKIASCDITNFPLIRHVVKKGKPVIVSTGMASLEEIGAVMNEIPRDRLILLHCVSRYPAPAETVNLRSIPFLREEFGVPVGYSDHTVGSVSALGAVALGAVMIEKHFTLDKNQEMGDHRLSAEPRDLRYLVDGIRSMETMLGRYMKEPDGAELETSKVMRRSIFAREDIPVGTVLTQDMLIPLRPAVGLSPALIDDVIGRKVVRHVKKGTPLTREMLSW